jgi:transposase-like protein
MSQVDLKKWRPHLRAAKAAGVTLAQYARKHGLSRHTLYAALRAERDRKGMRPKPLGRARPGRRSSAVNAAAFVPVAVSGASTRLTVRLPNGVAFECHDLEGGQMGALVACLAALPCSS